MDVQIYINNAIIDYSDNESLPFILKVAYRDFRKIAETETVDLDNASTSLPIPATKLNQSIFEVNINAFYTIDVIRNGQTFFKGRCRVSQRIFRRKELISYDLELYGGTADIFEQLEGLSLRDLDLGLIGYSAASVIATWTNLTSDDNDCIYLPSIYGELNSGTENYFELEDMRPSVYYETILAGIESYLNITIESNLRTSDLWKRAVHLYGVGNLWENSNDTIQTNLTTDGTDDTLTYTFGLSDTVVFKVEVNVPSGNNGAGDLNHVEIISSEGFTQEIAYDTTNGNNYVSDEITLTGVGQTIKIVGHKTTGHALTNLPNGTQFQITSTTKVVDGSSVKIESCLHDIQVKDWLKELFLQFNLVSFYNPSTKVLRIDPPFQFTVNSTTYEGFYKFGSTIKLLKTDSRNTAKVHEIFFDKMWFYYQANDSSEDLVNRYTTNNTHPINVIKVELNEGENSSDFESLYHNLFNGVINGITSNELPILVDEDVDLLDGAAAIVAPTFLVAPKNALVTGELMSAYFENVNYTNMPIGRQNNLRTAKDYTLTFSDATGRSGAANQTNEGLISLFYKQYFSILSRLEILKIKVEINSIFDIDTFRNIVKINDEFYILIELNNVSYNSNFCDGTFVKIDYIRNDDDFYTNFNPVGALQILNII